MVTRYRNYDEMVSSAQKAIDGCSNENSKWLQCLLDILKQKEYSTIVSKDGTLLDVKAIAHTYSYLSFFDVFNNIKQLDTTKIPLKTKELKNTIFKWSIMKL